MLRARKNVDQYKWVVWASLAAAFFIVFFHRYSTAVVADDLVRSLNLSGAQLSNLASMYFYAYALMQLPSGILADFLGPRRTATYGILLAALGSLIFGLAQIAWVAYAGRLMVGVGVSVVFVSTLKAQSVWFKPREFATVSGLTSIVGNIGGISATLPLALVVVALSWRSAFLLIAAFSIVVAAVVFTLVRDKPEDLGLPTQNELSGTRPAGIRQGLSSVLTNPQTWTGTLILAGVMGGIMSFSGLWGIPYLMHVYNLTKTQASSYVLAMTLGVMAGSPLMGYLADKLRRRKPILIIGSGTYTLTWVYALVVAKGQPTLPLLYALLFIAGLAGVSFILTFASAKEANHPSLSGIATSVVNTGGFFGAAALNMAVGTILEARWQGAYVAGTKIYPLTAYSSAFSLYLLAGILSLLVAFCVKDKIV